MVTIIAVMPQLRALKDQSSRHRHTHTDRKHSVDVNESSKEIQAKMDGLYLEVLVQDEKTTLCVAVWIPHGTDLHQPKQVAACLA